MPSSHLFPLQRILTASPSLRRLNRPNRPRPSPEFPGQVNGALHGRKDKNARETGLVWLIDYLDEVCNKRSRFPLLRSPQLVASQMPSDVSENRLSKLREIWRDPIAVAHHPDPLKLMGLSQRGCSTGNHRSAIPLQ